MRIVIEKFYDDKQNEIGELVIESDDRNFTVKTERPSAINKSGKTRKIHGQYFTLAEAVKCLARLKVMDSTAQTISELVQDLKRIEAYIHDKIEI